MNHQFSSLERDHMLEDMTKKTYDLFIIGEVLRVPARRLTPLQGE